MSKTKAPAQKPVQKKTQKAEESKEPIEQDLQLLSSSDSEEEENDNELSEDSDLSADEEEEDKIINDIKSKVGHTVNTSTKSISTVNTKQPKKRGIIYIGRIPQGFHEDEMKKYFSQFGNIINLRLCRNKHGKSKHFGFLEFDSFDVAQIAQETMNNYLIFNHILKVELVESVHKDIFNNTQSKFKTVPWKKIAKHQHDKPKSEEQRKALTKKFEESKLKKSKALESKGITFDLAAL